MTHEEIQAVADRAQLGRVHFQYNIARNTGQEFEVGYVFVRGQKELFCKREPRSTPADLYLCNEFCTLV